LVRHVSSSFLHSCRHLIPAVIHTKILISPSIASASIRCAPHLENSINILTQTPIELSGKIGVESWVVILISQINTLALDKAHLSPTTIVARGVEIQNQLLSGLASNGDKLGISYVIHEKTICQHLRVSQAKVVLFLSRIYALAALTYLHCTLSGPDPAMPAIVESTRQAIQAFEMIFDVAYMRNLVWPFCVTACFSRENREGFQAALRELEMEGNAGMLPKAWEVAEECWRLRREGDGRLVDWTDAMKSLGVEALLV
jgi:hypothetical protein